MTPGAIAGDREKEKKRNWPQRAQRGGELRKKKQHQPQRAQRARREEEEKRKTKKKRGHGEKKKRRWRGCGGGEHWASKPTDGNPWDRERGAIHLWRSRL